MPDKFTFPKEFFWGAATSAHQVEGGNHNDWSEWEKSPKRIAELKKEGKNPEEYISGRATDHYNRFHEDFDIAKSLGHNAHRFSIEWSRIEPEEGKFDEKEVEHYREVIKALRERGMEPFVTLWHWTNPLWVQNQGGWENKKTAADFSRYVGHVANAFKDSARFWVPLNEPSSYIGVSYVAGLWPPQVHSLIRANRVFHNLVRANRAAYSVIHRARPDAMVGVGHYLTYDEPYRNYVWNRLLTKLVDYVRNQRFLNYLTAASDFIGVQYYHHDALNLKLGKGRWGPIETKNKNEWVNDMGWEIYPRGLYHVLKSAAGQRKPIYITENGVADARDIHRVKFIREHLRSVVRAMQEGIDVRGYFYWSLLDNFEWSSGFEPRFGLVEINYKTMERKVRPSALEYKKIIAMNGVDL